MKKILSLVLVLAMALATFGCAPAAAPAASVAPSAAPEATPATPVAPSAAPEATPDAAATTKTGADLKVAVLIPGSPNDGGFCQLGAEGGKAVQAKYGCTVSIIEAATADLMKSEAETLCEEGYNVIFGHGGQYASPFAEISGDYPDTLFLTLGGAETTANQVPLILDFEESCYLGGIIGGMMTKTNKIGMLVGGDFPAYTKTTTAMELGAKSVNPDVEIMFAVLSNIDMNEAYETTMSQIKNGADFIFSNANQGSLGSMKAAVDSNVYAFGALADYSSEAPKNVIASGICSYNDGYIAAIERYLAGAINGKPISVGMADNVVRLVWNEELKATLPAEVIAAVEKAAAGIIDGSVFVPNEYGE